jgi:hypothetical protein
MPTAGPAQPLRYRAAMIYRHAIRDREKSIAEGLGKLFDAAKGPARWAAGR